MTIERDYTGAVSVGYMTVGDNKDWVLLTLNHEKIGLTPQLAKNLAVDLMLWADRVIELNNMEDEEKDETKI